MQSRTALRILFGFILLSLATYNLWASTRQPVWEWGGLTSGPDRWWTIATFVDAYYGFVTFYVWVFYKELRWGARVGWLVAIMGLGNIAMSAYVLWQLHRVPAGEPASAILTTRNA